MKALPSATVPEATATLTAAEWEYVVECLREGVYRQSDPVIRRLVPQLNEQFEKQQEPKEEPKKKAT